MDTKIENIDLLRSYILKLTNNDIYELEEISLTSAQKSRIASWCEANEIEIPDLNVKNFWKNQIKSKSIKSTAIQTSTISNSGVFSIGIDIQKIAEFFPEKNLFIKDDKSLLSIFTKKELSYAESKLEPRETLAGIFAAKESIFKCMNISSKNWSEIEIKYQDGKPVHKNFNISISHSDEYVVAVAFVGGSNSLSLKPDFENEVKNKLIQIDNKPIISNKAYKFINFLSNLGGLFFILYIIFNLFGWMPALI